MGNPIHENNVLQQNPCSSDLKDLAKQPQLESDTMAMVLFRHLPPSDLDRDLVGTGSQFDDISYQEVLANIDKSDAQSNEINLEKIKNVSVVEWHWRRRHFAPFLVAAGPVRFEMSLCNDMWISSTSRVSHTILVEKESIDSGYRSQSPSNPGEIRQNDSPRPSDLPRIDLNIVESESLSHISEISGTSSRTRPDPCGVNSNLGNLLLAKLLINRYLNAAISRRNHFASKGSKIPWNKDNLALFNSLSNFAYREAVLKVFHPELCHVFPLQSQHPVPGAVTHGSSSNTPNTATSSDPTGKDGSSPSRSKAKQAAIGQKHFRRSDEDDSGEGSDRHPKRRDTKPYIGFKKKLACPYRKVDKERFHRLECSNGFNNVPKLKKHLRKHHVLINTSNSCMQDCSSKEDLAEHQGQEACGLRKDFTLHQDNILIDPRGECPRFTAIKRYKRHGQAMEDWWFETFDILFPGRERPEDPYEWQPNPWISPEVIQYIDQRISQLVDQRISQDVDVRLSQQIGQQIDQLIDQRISQLTGQRTSQHIDQPGHYDVAALCPTWEHRAIALYQNYPPDLVESLLSMALVKCLQAIEVGLRNQLDALSNAEYHGSYIMSDNTGEAPVTMDRSLTNDLLMPILQSTAPHVFPNDNMENSDYNEFINCHNWGNSMMNPTVSNNATGIVAMLNNQTIDPRQLDARDMNNFSADMSTGANCGGVVGGDLDNDHTPSESTYLNETAVSAGMSDHGIHEGSTSWSPTDYTLFES